jgi:2-haloacid dehalogenase
MQRTLSRCSRRQFLAAGAASTALACATQAHERLNPDREIAPLARSVKALTFDVFGTVVDWRTSIIREGTLLGKAHRVTVDWSRFAAAWRAGYRPAIDRVRKGEIPWTGLDSLHRGILDDLLVQFAIKGLSEAQTDHLNRVWHRLMPWPDTVSGLNRLRSRYVLTALSNGNMSLLVNMAKNAGLPWDCILSAELSRHYKPDAEVYQMAARLLDLRPDQVMMVAAHPEDLQAAKKVGFKTAFVARPLEHGPDQKPHAAPANVDVNATDILDLAEKLGA